MAAHPPDSFWRLFGIYLLTSDPGRDHRADHRRSPPRSSPRSSCATPPRRRSASIVIIGIATIIALHPVDHLRVRRGRPPLHRRADAPRGAGRRARPRRRERPREPARPGWSAGIPVDPDAATARRWATRGAARPRLPRAALAAQPAAGLDRRAALRPARPRRRSTRSPSSRSSGARRGRRGRVPGGRSRAALAPSAARTAASWRTTTPGPPTQIRAAADAAAAAGDWALAVLERFRAIVRGLEERTVLDERAARTAHEAALAAAARLPALAAELVAAGRTVRRRRVRRRAGDRAGRGPPARARRPGAGRARDAPAPTSPT